METSAPMSCIVAMGFDGDEGSTRRAVAEAKEHWRADHRPRYRPWVPEPAMWLQFDWGEGPRIGVRAWLAWSRFRAVIPTSDQARDPVARDRLLGRGSFFGRAPDVVAHEEEVMWQVAASGWLYILRDAERAGNGIVAMAVSDIQGTVSRLEAQGVSVGPVKPEGDAGQKAVVI